MTHLTRGIYRAHLAENVPDSALALRHRRFRALRGQSQPTDTDQFDATCRHMLIHDTTTGDLVCTFRLMSFASGQTITTSYAAQFYDLTPLAALTEPMIELGRFCLHPDRNDPDILRLAWAALTRLVDAEAAALLFGCSSFDGADPAIHRSALAYLARHHLGPATLRPATLRPGVRAPAIPLRPADHPAPTLPPLLRTYLAMGAWVSDHAVIDRDLDTLHVFTALPIAGIPPRRAAALRALTATS